MGELVPELHDVLKLTTLNHSIYAWPSETYNELKPYFPATRTWEGVKRHHLKEDFQEYPTDPDTFYLCIADDLAASVSRVGETGRVRKELRKLWMKEGIPSDKLSELDDIKALLQFLGRDPTWEQFLQRGGYKEILLRRPEDEHEGRNVVTLYTHCKLTGQFYRLLRRSTGFEISPEELAGKTREQVAELRKIKEEREWKLSVARCKFIPHASPFKVRDLNLFLDVEELTDSIARDYPDNILLRTSDEVLLVFQHKEILDDVVRKACVKGFWVRQGKNRNPLPLNELGDAIQRLDITENRYGDGLEQEIFPICDLCQAAQATKVWPDEYVLASKQLCPQCTALLAEVPLSGAADSFCDADRAQLEDILAEPLRENLCSVCFSRRAQGVRLRKLAQWTREAGAKVAWLRLKLNFDQLVETLRELHPYRANVAPSVIGEFQSDYSGFLEEFRDMVHRSWGGEDVEEIMRDMYCLKLAGFGESLKLLGIFKEVMERFFPVFLELNSPSPVKIAVVCSGAKFPFFNVWRLIEHNDDDVFISIEDRRFLRAPMRLLHPLASADCARLPASALYKLARIESTSRTLAEIVFRDKRDEDAKTYSELEERLRGLDFSSIFTLTRIVGD